ncbi:MAG: hypothetical protein HY901_25775 [Deltaproteobacteria bacterium]|nr:hypothetical protein [Deltaproteobacteria bacterium]
MTWLALTLVLSASPVTLELDPCVPDVAALERSARLELGESEQAGSGPPLTVSVRCVQDEVELEVREGSAVRAHRRLDLRASPGPPLTRLLALAIAELISASRAEPAARTPISPDAPAPPASLPTPVGTARRADGPLWAGWLQAEGFAAFGAQHQLGVGARLGVERRLSVAAVRGELSVEHASEREPMGSLDELLVSGSVGGQLSPWPTRPVAFGLSAKLGLARLAGRPDENAAADGVIRLGPFAAVFAHAKARLAPVDRAGLVLGLELGYVVLPYRGRRSDGQLWGCDGAWLAFTCGWEVPW